MSNSVYTEVTESIIKQLEGGALPWVKPWKADSTADKNMKTGNAYQGINRLLLGLSGMMGGYSCPVWATFKQWNELGARVRKDEKGTMIVFYKPMTKGKNKVTGEDETYNLLTKSYVYNAAQVEGVTINPPAVNDSPFDAVAEAEARIVKTGARISHGGDAAFFAPSQDRIQLPHKNTFKDAGSYYATAFHELVHWTGAESRLNREFGKRFGDNRYAFEELVAEMGAAFLCQDYRIAGELRHAGYIEHWLKVLREDNKAIFKAAALAQKAADLINELDATAEAAAA